MGTIHDQCRYRYVRGLASKEEKEETHESEDRNQERN